MTSTTLNTTLKTSWGAPRSSPRLNLILMLRKLRDSLALTWRGIIILVLAGWMSLAPAWSEQDVVASILALILLLAVFILTISTTLLWLRAKSLTTLSLLPLERELTAGTSEQLLLHLKGCYLPPFYRAWVRLETTHNQSLNLLQNAKVELTPSTPQDLRVILPFTFPHRGDWELALATLTITDAFGLTELRRHLPIGGANLINVAPGPISSVALPVISSASTEGDVPLDRAMPTGDPFEFKTYNPALGARRIVWKMYARSGELFSRFPEVAAAPEGKTAIFMVADRDEDYVCSTLRQYIATLTDLGIDTIIGCEGMTSMPVAETPTAAATLFNESVWRTPSSSIVSELESFASTAAQRIPLLDSIVIFCSRQRVSSESDLKTMTKVGELLLAAGIRPIFVVVSHLTSSRLNSAVAVDELPRWASNIPAALQWWLFESPHPKHQKRYVPTGLKFDELALQRGWEVFIQEVSSIQ